MKTKQLQGRQDFLKKNIHYICTPMFWRTKGYLGLEDFCFFVSRSCLADDHMSIRGLHTDMWFLALPRKKTWKLCSFFSFYWFYFSKNFLSKWTDFTQLTWCNLKKIDEVYFRKNYTCSNQPSHLAIIFHRVCPFKIGRWVFCFCIFFTHEWLHLHTRTQTLADLPLQHQLVLGDRALRQAGASLKVSVAPRLLGQRSWGGGWAVHT